MTERLYYDDAYLRAFDAAVVSCRPLDGGFAVVLDRTAFYPEGGGQPGDRGMLDGVRVTDTRMKDGEIVHITAAPLTAGAAVRGEIDWDRRFDLMQQHSGEHIVSGLVHARFGLENVGFHMGADTVVIDFSGPLDMEQLREIETEANRIVWRDAAVRTETLSGAALADIAYRSKKELSGDVRIVTFPGADVCACCGTHVRRAGEIGCIRLLDAQGMRGGVRVQMVSGGRCLGYFQAVAEQNHRVSAALSARERETAAAVERLMEENTRLKERAAALEGRIFDQIAAAWSGKEHALVFEPGLAPDSVRRLCDRLMDVCPGVCAVFSGGEGGCKYAVGRRGGDVRPLVKELNAALGGRGGGKPPLAQGSVAADEDDIRAFFAHTL